MQPPAEKAENTEGGAPSAGQASGAQPREESKPAADAECKEDWEEGLVVDKQPPRRYGFWVHGKGDPRAKPWALILFSGKSRRGDLQRALARKGWRVCAIDTVAPKATNLLCDATWESIHTDIVHGNFSAVWIATPCETFSPLREKRPGPRVLRTLDRIQGLPRDTLTQGEQKQLKESNILVDRSASAAIAQSAAQKPWGLENPDHGEDRPSLWHMPSISTLAENGATMEVKFDQCRLGLSTTKPTKLLLYKTDLSHLHNLRCNHPVQTYQREDGSTGRGAHIPTVQRWVVNEKGERERASKSQGQYTPEFSEAIAGAFHASQAGAQWLKDELGSEELP